MKKLFVTILPLMIALCASAQTYQGGVWYSYYNAGGFELNTIASEEITGIFAPTARTITFNSSYNKLTVGAFPKNKTYVYESSNGGSSSNEIGQALPDLGLSLSYSNWGKEWSNSLTCSSNINWLKFDRATGNTHVNKIYNIKIALAKHILLPSGTYGTTTASKDFGEVDALSASEAYHVNLRSFLTAGDITITSSDPTAFRINSTDNTEGITYAVGANACASANGTATAAGGSALGKIANYGFDIYFTPQQGGDYSATITITDGTSTATVAVSGKGLKLDQSITWDPETTLLSNGSIAVASASSGLEVDYTIEPEGIVSYENGVFSVLSEGLVTITASQAGNEVYNAAQNVSKTFTIFPAVTNYAYQATICDNETYSDENFENLSQAAIYYDTIANVYGGDSIISLALTVLPTYAIGEQMSMYEGQALTWQDIDLSVLPLGDTTLVAEYQTVTNCDSIYTLQLSVLDKPTTYGEYDAHVCAGESIEFEGKAYKRSTKDTVLLAQKNQYGGDSVVYLNVTVHPLSKLEMSQSIEQGTDTTWQDIDLSLMEVGDTTLTVVYESMYGCDSTLVLHLTVIASQVTSIEQVLKEQTQDDKVFINGNLYIRKDDGWYDVNGRKVY